VIQTLVNYIDIDSIFTFVHIIFIYLFIYFVHIIFIMVLLNYSPSFCEADGFSSPPVAPSSGAFLGRTTYQEQHIKDSSTFTQAFCVLSSGTLFTLNWQ